MLPALCAALSDVRETLACILLASSFPVLQPEEGVLSPEPAIQMVSENLGHGYEAYWVAPDSNHDLRISFPIVVASPSGAALVSTADEFVSHFPPPEGDQTATENACSIAYALAEKRSRSLLLTSAFTPYGLPPRYLPGTHGSVVTCFFERPGHSSLIRLTMDFRRKRIRVHAALSMPWSLRP